MAFEINDLKGILILVLFGIPMVASTNINCNGRAFHCVNSTHFMICVDLGGGLSTTIDDFVIPCPATTVCHENNVFECDFPEVTTPPPPLQVIGVYKQSDTSESTSVTNSVTAPKPASEIFSVFKENISATTLPVSEDVTPVVKLEVLENIKDSVGVSSGTTTEASFKVTSSFNDSTNEVVNDKQTSNKTLTISVNDNDHLEPAVETSIHKAVNTPSTDKSKSIDAVTSVIGLINLISTDHPSTVNTKPSSDVFTSLDTLYDHIATTTDQYITKQVTIHGEKVENVTKKIIIPTEIILNERSVTTDEVSTKFPVVNMYIESDKNNTTEFINKIDSGNQTIAVESNNTSELVPETISEYLAPVNIVNISEAVSVDLRPETKTDNTFIPLGLVELISADPKQNAPSTNDYINSFYGNIATTTMDQYTIKLETTLSDKPVTAEVISTTPIINTIFQNVLKNDVNNDSLTELNSTVDITSMKKVPETNINYFIPDLVTIENLQTTTENTFFPVSTETKIMYTTEMIPKSEDLIKNDSLVGKHTTTTQPLEILVTTDSPIQPTDNLYLINREMNQTMIPAKNNRASTINTTERVETVFNDLSTDIVNNQVTEPTLFPPTTLKNHAIELTTAETLQNGLTAKEVKNQLRATNAPIIDVENVENDTLLYNTTYTTETTTGKTFFPVSTEPNIMYTTEMTPKAEDLIKNDSLVGKHTTATQPLEIIVTTDSPIQPPDNLYLIYREMNQTMITAKNNRASTINTTERVETVFNDLSTDIVNNQVKEPTLLPPTTMKNHAIELTTAETLQSGLTAKEVKNQLRATNAPIIDVENVENDTLLYNTTYTNETGKTVFNASSTDTINGKSTESSTETLQNGFTVHAIEAKNELPGTNGPMSDMENVGIDTLLSVHTIPGPYNVASNSVTNTTGKDLKISQSDNVTNPQIGFTAEIITHNSSDGSASLDHGTTEIVTTDAETKIPGYLNQSENLGTLSLPENLKADHLTKTVVDKDVGMTTLRWKNGENSATTPFPSDFTGTTFLSDSVKSVNQDNISATNVVNTKDVLITTILPRVPSTVYYMSELPSTTPIIDQKTPLSIDTMKISEQVSSYTPEIVETGYKIDTSSTVDVTHKADIENVTDIPVTTLPPHESTNQKIGAVTQLNTTSPTIETVSDLIPVTVKTTGYVVLNSTNFNTSSWKDSVNMDTISSKVDLHAGVNKTETVKPINGKNSDNATSPSSTIKDENITIVSVFDIVHSSVNAMPYETLQPTSSNSSLSNDYIKTTESQDSSGFVTATNNVPEYNLVQAGELVTQKNPARIVSFAQTNEINSILSKPSTNTLPTTEINTEKVEYVGTEVPLPSTVELKHINPTKIAVQYVTEKTNDYISSTEAIPTELNMLPKVKAEYSVSSVTSVIPSTVVKPDGFTTVPVNDAVTKIKDSAFIISSTQISPKIVTGNSKKISTESPLLTSNVMETQTVMYEYNTESSLPISELPLAQMTPEATAKNNVSAQNTPLEKMNQDALPGISTADLPQYAMSTVNNNIPQLMASLPILGLIAAHKTTESTHTTKVFAQTTSLVAATGKTNQDILPEINTADLPQYVMLTGNKNTPQSMASPPIVGVTAAQITTEPTFTTSLVIDQTTRLDKMNQDELPGTTTADLPFYVMLTLNKNIPRSMASLPTVGLTAAQMTTESTHTTNVFAQTTSLLAAAGKTNQDVLPGIKTTDFPQSTMLTVNNNIFQSIKSLPIAAVSASQITTKPTHTNNVFSQTTPLLAAAGKTIQDRSEVITTDLPQDVTTTVLSNNTQWVSDIQTKINTDSQAVPDSMVETIKVVGDKVSGSYLENTTLSDVMYNNPTVNNTNYSVKSVKNIIDHESIVIGSTSKNNEQNTFITSAMSVDINKAEIVNHTESNWMRSDVDIDSVKIKESSIEEEDSKSSVFNSSTDGQNKNLVSDSSIISKVEPNDDLAADQIENRLTTVAKNYKIADSGAPRNVTQSKKIITKENKNAEIDSTLNDNIEIINVKRYQVQVESKNISDGYNVNNTKVNITSQHNYSLQKSTNDELEQYLISTNHTIMTEVQSHLNESDKQSNITNDELILNETGMHNPNLTSINLNASSKAVSALDFNCSNHTRGKYADKKDCRKFYTCIGNLQPMLGTCPNNTVFSEINKQCTRNLSHCVRNNQFRCLFEGRFSDFFQDNIYYICVKNRMNGFIRYKLQCQDDYHLNKDSVKCEKNEEISTQSVSSVSETNNDKSKPQPKSEKIVSIDDFECESEGKFPYAKDCSKNYVCNQIKNVYYICVKNRMNGFIRYKLQCQDDYHLNKESVKCEKNVEISTQLASSVSETNNDKSKPQPKSEKIVSIDDFECENEGKFPYAKDCSKYYLCTKIKNVYRREIKKCTGEEVFDKKKKKCVESDSGEC